jgi:hypothetical protein
MSEIQRHQCFGTMFPDVLHLPLGKPASGKVFSVLLKPGEGIMRSKRSMTADLDEWDECVQCPEFDHCYKFSLAKLTLQSAIAIQ